MGLWDSIKNKWNQMTGNAPVDHVSEQRRRRKLRESINDPDDLFFDDEVLDREELERVARKRRNRNSFRRGYYIFGAILGTAMIVIAVYNMLSTPKPDLQVLLQEDGLIEQGDIEDIQAFWSGMWRIRTATERSPSPLPASPCPPSVQKRMRTCLTSPTATLMNSLSV